MYYWSWACLLYISSFSFFVLHIDFSLFWREIPHLSKKKKSNFLQFLATQLSNSFFFKKIAIIVCKETIHTGSITAHAFTNLSCKFWHFFLPSFMGTIFPLKTLEKLHCNAVKIAAFASNRSKCFCFLWVKQEMLTKASTSSLLLVLM